MKEGSKKWLRSSMNIFYKLVDIKSKHILLAEWKLFESGFLSINKNSVYLSTSFINVIRQKGVRIIHKKVTTWMTNFNY